jgi:hypothetical protein
MIIRIVKTEQDKFHLIAMLTNGAVVHEKFDSKVAVVKRARQLTNVPVTFIKL